MTMQSRLLAGATLALALCASPAHAALRVVACERRNPANQVRTPSSSSARCIGSTLRSRL